MRNSAASSRPRAIGHRIAHGGLEFVEPAVLTQEVINRLDRLVTLEPLHLPGNLAAVRAAGNIRPDLPQVACFDTAFHRGRARVTERFGLPHDLSLEGVRRWGFYGLACTSALDQLREAAPELVAGRVILAHLGDGSGGAMCGVTGRPKRGHHDGLFPARRAAHGHAVREPRPRRRALPRPVARLSGGRALLLEGVGPIGDLGHQQRRARAARERKPAAPPRRSTISSTGRSGRSGR